MVKSNQIICGDCVDVMSNIPDESIDLIYADPPFYSCREYVGKTGSFNDKWLTFDSYLSFMKVRVVGMHRILKSTGSLYLHCDDTASHYLKELMDVVFGKQNFRNEIIWHYRKWSAGWQQFQRNHDVILFYSKSKSKDRTFNKMYMERAESTKKRFGNKKIISGYDENGKRTPAQLEETDSLGVSMDDVWNISRVPPIKQIYPTQKPEVLLERIIKASSNPNDIILDPFCGSGTTCRVAKMLDRKYIGIDVSTNACDTSKKRV